MKEQPRLGIEEVLDMHKELPLRLGDVLGPIEKPLNLSQGHNSHHQRIKPELLIILSEVDDMLHSAVPSAGQFVHRPLGPSIQPWEISDVASLLVDIS